MDGSNSSSLLAIAFLLCFGFQWNSLSAQDSPLPEESQFEPSKTRLWINTYGNIRLSDKFFWVAQTHFRRQQTDDVPFVGQMAQLYNRHAISYMFSKSFNASLGGVLRVNFNTNQTSSSQQRANLEWRIWHEYQFAVPVSRAMIYHRIRLEHRWTRSFEEGSDYDFRNRWRYMFNMKIPINKAALAPETFYIAPEAELIMQSGKTVVDSPLEDLRLHTSFGYILNARLTFAAGLMYSMGQELYNGGIYNQKWTMRFHVYFSPDFRKVKNKLPSVNLMD